jgi:hypothetical protein
MIGSCFSENIGTKLIDQRFKIYNNPNGNLFNPASIHHCLDTLLQGKPLEEKFLFNRDGIFYSYLHHSSIHDEYKNDLRKKIEKENQQATQFLKESNYLIITFGTAFVYKNLELQTVVANCHKQPASFFEKQLLTIQSIVASYSTLFKDLLALNPNLKIIFTVSYHWNFFVFHFI